MKYLAPLKMMFHILVFHIPGAGHPTEFTISYTGDCFARQYLGAENDKIWKLKVMTMGFITFSRIAYT